MQHKIIEKDAMIALVKRIKCQNLTKEVIKMNKKITKDMLIGDVLKVDGNLAPTLLEIGMHCLGCPSSQMESLSDACLVHGVNADELVAKLNAQLEG